MSPNISALEDEIKRQFIFFDLQLEEELDFLHAVAIQAGQDFNLTFEKSRSFLSSMTAKICFKIMMLVKSLVALELAQSFQS